MRYLFRLLCVCSLAVLPIWACSSTPENGGDGGTGGDAGTGGDGGTGGIAGTGGTGGDGFRYTIRFTGLEPDGSIISIEGVELCEAGTDNCAMSDVLGSTRIDVPADQEVAFTIEKEGYGSWLTASVSDGSRETSTTRRMYTNEQLEAVADQLNTDYPWTGGIVGLVNNPSETEGLTFAAVGSTVGEVGEVFYYDSEAEEYSSDLEAGTAVEANWYLPLGAGGFTEVTPGEQQFELGGTAGDCEPSWAWAGDAQNTIRLPVREGYRTYGSMRCDQP